VSATPVSERQGEGWRIAGLLAVLLLAGCEDFNDRNIRQYKACQAAGMEAVQNYGGSLTCMPPKKGCSP
jgi:hypothetical protein